MTLLMSDPLALTFLVLLGVVAGVLGGMLGVGGSIVIIPGLAILFSFDRTPDPNQHLFQAAAMIVNVAVSIPATLRHRKADALVPDALVWMLPASLVCVITGVWVSNLPLFEGADGGRWLGRILAVFLIYVIVINTQKLRDASPIESVDGRRVTPARSSAVGAVLGSLAGLLGIGGGAIAVPLQLTLLKLPLRNCIANSSAIICISATVGAIYKNATLSQHLSGSSQVDWRMSLVIAAMLAPTAWAGARLGASLTHRLPLRQIRIAFIALMAVAAWKMAALPLGPFSG